MGRLRTQRARRRPVTCASFIRESPSISWFAVRVSSRWNILEPTYGEMKELLRKDFPDDFRAGNHRHCRFCKLLDKTETPVERGTRRFKGTEAKANLVLAATCQTT